MKAVYTQTKTARTPSGVEFEYQAPLPVVGALVAGIAAEKSQTVEDWNEVTGDQLRWIATLCDIEEALYQAFRARAGSYEETVRRGAWEAFGATPLADITDLLTGVQDAVVEFFADLGQQAREDAELELELDDDGE